MESSNAYIFFEVKNNITGFAYHGSVGAWEGISNGCDFVIHVLKQQYNEWIHQTTISQLQDLKAKFNLTHNYQHKQSLLAGLFTFGFEAHTCTVNKTAMCTDKEHQQELDVLKNKWKYYCQACDYGTNTYQCMYAHKQSNKHCAKNDTIVPFKYYCCLCDYGTNSSSNFKKHTRAQYHIQKDNGNL